MNFEIGSGKTKLSYNITRLGPDILIVVTGGEAHIGCTAIGDKGSISSYTPKHHRDDSLAIPLAKKISEKKQCVCTVVAGFHLDNISKDQIAEVIKNAKEGMTKILEML